MLEKFVSIILLICISGQSPLVAAMSVHDSHHNSESSIHHYLHEIGQPHEHDDKNAEKFEISYSKQALEHNNAHHDGGVIGIFAFLSKGIPNIVPEARLDTLFAWWPSPFIKYDTPPPKL